MKEETKTNQDDKPKPILSWTDWQPCLNPSHNFPSHLYIEPGQTYKHVCPGCGNEITVAAPMIYW